MNMRQKAHKRIIELITDELAARMSRIKEPYHTSMFTEEILLDEILKEIRDKILYLGFLRDR